jgi:hypothetical protein
MLYVIGITRGHYNTYMKRVSVRIPADIAGYYRSKNKNYLYTRAIN